MFGKADLNGNDLVEFEEFGPLWEQLAPPDVRERQMKLTEAAEAEARGGKRGAGGSASWREHTAELFGADRAVMPDWDAASDRGRPRAPQRLGVPSQRREARLDGAEPGRPWALHCRIGK